MTGPEHYTEAERLADAYKDAITTAEAMPSESMPEAEARVIALSGARSLLDKAQVHATLALTAATAEPIAQAYDGLDDVTVPRAWSKAIS